MSLFSNRQKGLVMNTSMVDNPVAARRIQDLTIPKCLTDRKLVMGDAEQVRALRSLEKRAEEIIAWHEEYGGWEDGDDDDDDDEVITYP